MDHADAATMSLVRRNTQRDGFTYAAGFSITLFRASFFIASSAEPQPSNSQRVTAPPRRSKQSKTHDMPAKPLEVMPTIAESVPFDITYEDLSNTTRGLQDRVRRQYQQNHERQSDAISLRRLEAAAQAQRGREAALDRHSLRVLEAATARARNTRPGVLHDRSSQRAKQSMRSSRAAVLRGGSSKKDTATTEHSRSPSQRIQGLEAVAGQTSQEITSATNAAAQTTALRIQALSTLTSPADSFVRVESSPSTPSSSLFRLPTRPVYQRALDTDPGPSALPVRPTLFQRTLTAFPEIGKLVGATVPPPSAVRPFTRVDSGAYSSDNPPSSGRPLRPVGESTSPSWSSEDEAGMIPIIRAAEIQGRYDETPPKKSVRQSRISGWTSEEEALAATRDDYVHVDNSNEPSPPRPREGEVSTSVQGEPVDVKKKRKVEQETPSKVSKRSPIRQPQSPSWSTMEEALGTAEDDFIQVEKHNEASSETSSHGLKQSVQPSRGPSQSSKGKVSASLESDLDIAGKQNDQISSPEIGDESATDSVEDDFDLIEDGDECGTFELPTQDATSPSLKDDDSTIPPAAKTQKWLEDQLADAMRSSAPATPRKSQDEYADLFSPTLGHQAGSESGSDVDKSVHETQYMGEDGEVEEFEDWEDLGDER